MGMASVFHTLVFCIALIRVGRRASPASAMASSGRERGDSSKRRADPSPTAVVRTDVGMSPTATVLYAFALAGYCAQRGRRRVDRAHAIVFFKR